MHLQHKQAAAIIVWRRHQEGHTEIFLAKRSEQLAAFGGFWAFVGGSVDAEDAQLPILEAACAPELVGAAARELFEETGILVTEPQALGPSATGRGTWRTEVLKDGSSFAQRLLARRLRIDGRAFVPFGRWTTPPFSPARFDCQYFALQLPKAQACVLWPGELSAGAWLTPKAALEAHEQGEMLLAYPVLCTLRLLHEAQCDMQAAARLAQNQPDALDRRTHSLVPGVRMLPVKTPTLPPATHTNCYILGDKELVIVDPGTPYANDQTILLHYIDGLVSRGAKVREIWLTHAHPDHTGCAALASAHFSVPIAAHADCAEALRQDGDCKVDKIIEDKAHIDLAGDYHWQALHTPGHAPGHLCFYENKRRHLLSGDNVLGFGSSIVAPRPHGSMADYMKSLHRLLALDLGILLPGHGPPVATAVATLKRYIAHRRAREDKIIAAIGPKPISAEQLLAQAYDDIKPQLRAMAQVSLAAHTEKLIEEKQILAIDGGFVRC